MGLRGGGEDGEGEGEAEREAEAECGGGGEEGGEGEVGFSDGHGAGPGRGWWRLRGWSSGFDVVGAWRSDQSSCSGESGNCELGVPRVPMLGKDGIARRNRDRHRGVCAGAGSGRSGADRPAPA